MTLSLVLPIHNEEEIIAPVVAEILSVLREAAVAHEIVLVENGSTDGSLTVLRRLAADSGDVVVVVAEAKGWGRAIQAGWRAARGDWVAHMPSDGQIDPAVLPELLDRVASGQADLVKVRRVRRENRLRQYNSWVYNRLARLLFGTESRDVNGCPKVFARVLLDRLQITSADSFLDLELLVKMKFLGIRLAEVPIISRARLGGRSNTSPATTLEFLRNMIAFRWGPSYRRWRQQVR